MWYQYSVPLSAYSVGQALTIGLGYVGYDGAQAGFDALSDRRVPASPAGAVLPVPDHLRHARLQHQ